MTKCQPCLAVCKVSSICRKAYLHALNGLWNGCSKSPEGWCRHAVEIMQELQSQGAMAQADTSRSNLTKLMCNSLGGNAFTLFMGTFKQGQLAESEALLKFLQIATVVESFPIRNESHAQGLLHVLSRTISQLKNERKALEQQLDEGGPQTSGVSASKVSRLREQNLQLKEEVAAMLQEKSGLQQKLETLQKAGKIDVWLVWAAVIQ